MLALVVFMHRDVNMLKKGKKRFSHNLCHQNKAPIQWAAKAVCSNGLYIQALQQLKHLPKSLGQTPVRFQCALRNKQAHSQGALLQSAMWAGRNKKALWYLHENMSNRPLSPLWVCPATEHAFQNVTSYIILTSKQNSEWHVRIFTWWNAFEITETFPFYKDVSFFHVSMQLLLTSKYFFIMWRVVMKPLWHSLWLTRRWDDIWLVADAALIIYVDEGGP